MRRLRWMLVLIPALVIGGFETIRHTLLEQALPMEVGNWLTACIDAVVIALITRKLIDKFAQTERELGAERAMRVVLEERERLARVLHDHIAQSIFYSGVQLSAAKKVADQLNEDSLVQKLKEVEMSLREIDENVRQSIFNLRESQHDDVDIRSRFRSYLERALGGTSIEWSLSFPEEGISLNLNEQIQLFGIMQELVTNIIKHARATRICVSVQPCSRDLSTWMFEVSDNGVGMSDHDPKSQKFGMDIVYSRARDISAEVQIDSNSDGVTVRVAPAAGMKQLGNAAI